MFWRFGRASKFSCRRRRAPATRDRLSRRRRHLIIFLGSGTLCRERSDCGVKDFAVALGGHSTDNFLHHSNHGVVPITAAIPPANCSFPSFTARCALCGKTAIAAPRAPSSTMSSSIPSRRLRAAKRSSQYRSPKRRPSVAGRRAARGLHNQREARKAPTEVAKPRRRSRFFLPRVVYAQERFGVESRPRDGLRATRICFLRKSLIVNQYYDKVGDFVSRVPGGAR